ncbi:MAG: NAD-dependent epimerase/dehydratase family protein [Sphingobium sp.]
MGDPHILVAGASGLVGRAAVERFAAAERRVTAVSRRPPIADHGATFVAVDLADPTACRAAFSGLGVTHVVYAALHEEPRLVDGWVDPAHVARNGAMLANLMEAVDGPGGRLRHVSIVQGPKAYGVHAGSAELPAREDRSERRDIPNFYWAQEDYLKARQPGRDWRWTVFRPGMVIGQAIGSAMNFIAVVGVYGALLKARGEPLHYPGTMNLIAQPSDTDLMAHAFEWAMDNPAAANQIFNITNGEVIALKTLWPAIAAAMGMEPGDDRSIDFTTFLPGAVAQWDVIAARHGLRAPAMAPFLAQSPQFANFCFSLGTDGPVPPGIMSTIKLRRSGFADWLDSEEMFAKWFARYQRDGLLPPP